MTPTSLEHPDELHQHASARSCTAEDEGRCPVVLHTFEDGLPALAPCCINCPKRREKSE